MPAGDHLVVFYGTFSHHGIALDDDAVIHLSKKSGKICRSTLDEFRESYSVEVCAYDACDPTATVIERALSREGEAGYCLFAHNCEHFATWCKTGRAASGQAQAAARRIVAAAAKGTVKATTCILAKQTSKLGVKTITRAASPWLFLADLGQFATEFTAVNLGVSPVQATELGRRVGFAGSVTIGAALAGPAGATIGASLWAFGERVGSALGE
jgi:hypothetical protein